MEKKELTHYGETRNERAARRGIHPSCLENRTTALCGNGSYWAKTTRNKELVDCPACLERIKQ